jgi:GntR family transcriptional regulator, vanillate catabolism transcriptional regulator
MQETERSKLRLVPRGDSAQTVKATLGLRQLLFGGEIGPGERLVELALVERLGVSRTPLRLALTTLEHEGLVTSLPGGGFAVREFTRADIDDAIELRGVLEGTAARFAAERLETDAELAAIRSLTARLDETVHDAAPEAVLAYVELNEAFHAQLVLLAKSEMLARELARVTALPFASPAALLESHVRLSQREILLVAQHQHHAVVEAIAAGHGARAEEVAREHARISRRSLDLALDEDAVLGAIPGAQLLNVNA